MCQCRLLLPSIRAGFNASVYTYGQTGAGKTYTMLCPGVGDGVTAHVRLSRLVASC